MNSILNELFNVRKQLVNQQSLVNECLGTVDGLIASQFNNIPNNQTDGQIIPNLSEQILTFPKSMTTKRDKLKHILSEAKEPMTAKDIKIRLSQYGETLPNVDQSLVNLEKDGLIKSKLENGRKKYYKDK